MRLHDDSILPPGLWGSPGDSCSGREYQEVTERFLSLLEVASYCVFHAVSPLSCRSGCWRHVSVPLYGCAIFLGGMPPPPLRCAHAKHAARPYARRQDRSKLNFSGQARACAHNACGARSCYMYGGLGACPPRKFLEF